MCETVVRRECTSSTRQTCRTEECTTQYQTVCDSRAARQLDLGTNKGRTFGNIGVTGNLGGGLGFGSLRRPGVSANVDAGININTGSLNINNNKNKINNNRVFGAVLGSTTGSRTGCRSVPKKSCRKLAREQCSSKTDSPPQCRDLPSRECRKVARPVKRQQCVAVPKCVSVPRTQCRPVQR